MHELKIAYRDGVPLPHPLNFAPTITEEIAQNLVTLFTTERGSLPLDRAFGVDLSFLDFPTNAAMQALRAEFADAARRYEPRALIRQISFEHPAPEDGRLFARIRWDEA